MHIFLLYLFGINMLTFILMGADKRKARKRMWRIPERTFWLFSLLGGTAGSLIGMRAFRHKTKHRAFTIGMPVLMVCQLLLLIAIMDLS